MPASAKTGLTGHMGSVSPVGPYVLDQISAAPIGHVLASWILLAYDMAVDMALESTEARFPHAPIPD